MGNTANLLLPYMENTDPLANVAAAQKALADAIDAKLGTTPAAFASALTAVTTNPSIGTGGTVDGWFVQRGKASVEFTVNIMLGSAGLSGGAGQWKIKLPVGAHATKNGLRRDFNLDLLDASAGVSYSCVAQLVASVDPSYLFLNYRNSATGILASFTGAANPPAGLANGDTLTVHGVYVPA